MKARVLLYDVEIAPTEDGNARTAVAISVIVRQRKDNLPIMSNITKAQLDHLHQLIEEFHKIMEPKYKAGAIEHKGNIWEKSDEWLEEQETMEIIDLAVYRLTRLLKRK